MACRQGDSRPLVCGNRVAAASCAGLGQQARCLRAQVQRLALALLLFAQSRHRHSAERCPLLGVKRTSQLQSVMSAFDPKRTCAVIQFGYSRSSDVSPSPPPIGRCPCPNGAGLYDDFYRLKRDDAEIRYVRVDGATKIQRPLFQESDMLAAAALGLFDDLVATRASSSLRTEIAEGGLLPPITSYRIKNCDINSSSKRTVSL
jgi:hypothetical protein